MISLPTPVRVALIEDHAIYRDGLIAAIERSEDLVYVGHSADIAGSSALLSTSEIDVVLVDLTLPDGSGLEVVTQARQMNVESLVLSMSPRAELVIRAIQSGARGYMVKDAGWPDIHAAILAVARGEVVFGAKVADEVLESVANQDARRAAFPRLTPREFDVLELLVAQRTNQQIAQQLYIAPKTARNLVSSLLSKLNASTRDQAAEIARQAGVNAP
jgi:DNA-binding NarL/FixJ family response regulator